MSSASTNLGSLVVINGPDFWELTNFGTNTINLNGYHYTDSLSLPMVPLPGMSIQPRESVLFVRTDTNTPVANEGHFRVWWGNCLATNVQVRMVPRTPGFDAQSDGVRVYDAASNLVDRVDFGISRRGVTFVYDTNSGEFGIYSQPSVCGTCKAAQADDIGSPGATCGPVPLRIFTQPTNTTVCAGMDATFAARAGGLPRARYQWYFNGVEIPGAVGASLTVSNATPAHVGAYYVEVNNGAAVISSAPASLAVSTDESSPVMVTPPSNISVITGQTARLSATVCAYPPATYQWRSNGVLIAQATNRSLVIANCALAMSGTEYCVEARNSLGATSACARLTVTLAPKIQLTEIMPSFLPDCLLDEDWFELTNVGTNAVDLFGYRFSDRFTLIGARVVSETVLLKPGGSAIFVERMNVEAFRQWWGEERLPPGLQVVTYVGLGFSEEGDEFYLWSPGAEEAFDVITSASFAGATPGVSIDFTENIFGEDSIAGERGAFLSTGCGDVGSPGYVTNAPPRFVKIWREANTITLKWRAIIGKTYHLKWKTRLTDAGWTSLASHPAEDWVETASDSTAGNATQRFYLVEELP